ncbi:MAG: DUF4352 domain-containing protein [Candidatus Ancillula sp.]|jgi:hypothetical protein|nr:DUF4352 domain-containing protein [Candidatus Ancillula sp.]
MENDQQQVKVIVKEKKKPIYKRVWFWIIVIIVLAAAAGGGSEASKDKNVASNSSNSSSTSNSSKDKDTTHKLGEVFQVGDIQYKVNTISVTNQITTGNEFVNEEAKKGSTFLIVNIDVTNKASESKTFDSSYLKLKNGEKTYDAADYSIQSTANWGDGTSSSGDAPFFESMNPDTTVSGNVAFEVTPEVANAVGLQLQVQTGVWGTETGLVTLR